MLPRCGSLSTVIEPPLCCTMPYTVASPRPVPFPSGYLDIDASRLALDRRTRLLHKPFSPEALVEAVQSMLAVPVPA